MTHNTDNLSSNVLAERLEKLRRRALDARYSDASADELTGIGQQIEETKNELFQKRAQEQKERQEAANARMLAARGGIEQEHIRWQQGRGTDPGSYARGDLKR
jgi:hypothetical protein